MLKRKRIGMTPAMMYTVIIFMIALVVLIVIFSIILDVHGNVIEIVTKQISDFFGNLFGFFRVGGGGSAVV